MDFRAAISLIIMPEAIRARAIFMPKKGHGVSHSYVPFHTVRVNSQTSEKMVEVESSNSSCVQRIDRTDRDSSFT